MLRVRYDSKEVNKILGNAVKYSYGFLEGIDMEQIIFNQKLGEYTVDALNRYIDAQARGNPNALHHVYEWGATGNSGARLFSINSRASKRVIHFEGKFLKSKTVSDTATEPFTDKANIMENRIGITVAPNQSDVLAFEYNGDMVFTTKEIYIANPGGDEVAGSFGRVVDNFFSNYFTNALLGPFVEDLQRAEEFSQYFPEGTKSGRGPGIKAGRKYLDSAAVIME